MKKIKKKLIEDALAQMNKAVKATPSIIYYLGVGNLTTIMIVLENELEKRNKSIER